MYRRLSPLLALSFLIAGCTWQNATPDEPPMQNQSSTPAGGQENLPDMAHIIINALSERDMETVAAYVHEEKGLLFAPYPHIALDDSHTFTKEHATLLVEDSAKYTWGTQEGSGEPIFLTFNDYYDRYIYEHDFKNAPEVTWNEYPDRGTIISNITEVFPGAESVEYFFPGFDPQYGGMDWKSLRLVFQEIEGSWHLVAIVHNEWTP